MGKRTRYSAEFKARVAIEAIRGEQTLSELAARHGVHPNLISQWKRHATDRMASLFGGGSQRSHFSADGTLIGARASLQSLKSAEHAAESREGGGPLEGVPLGFSHR